MAKMSAPLVCVIVITFNGKHHLARCLPTLLETIYPALRLIVLDNHSQDGSAEYVQTNFPTVEVVRHPANYGFAKGNNLVIQKALDEGAEYVLLLNDDTCILDPNWLSDAVRVAEGDPRTGMVGFELTVNLAHPLPEARAVREVERIDGCALLIRGSLLRRIGLLDEAYFAYCEESDLEARALRAGSRLVEINVPLYHAGGGTFGRYSARFVYLYLRNRMRFSIKNESVLMALLRPLLMLDLAGNPWPVQRGPRYDAVRRRLRTGNPLRNLSIFAAALVWNVVFLPQTLWSRRRDEQRIKQARSGDGLGAAPKAPSGHTMESCHE